MAWHLSSVSLSCFLSPFSHSIPPPTPIPTVHTLCGCVHCLSRRGLMLRLSVRPCGDSRRAMLSWRTSCITVPSPCANSYRNSSKGWVVSRAEIIEQASSFRNLESGIQTETQIFKALVPLWHCLSYKAELSYTNTHHDTTTLHNTQIRVAIRGATKKQFESKNQFFFNKRCKCVKPNCCTLTEIYWHAYWIVFYCRDLQYL